MGLIQKLFSSLSEKNKGLTILEADAMLHRANELANIANTTTNREEFYNSINEIKIIFRELSKFENEIPFIGSPSADLRNLEQMEQKQIEFLEKRIAEKEKGTEQNIHAEQNQNKGNNKMPNEELYKFDIYIIEAGCFVIERDKASIGMIQREFKIGFRRAERIMKMLEQMGVVSEEDGTKPRKILITMEDYNKLIEDYRPEDIILSSPNSDIHKQDLYKLLSISEKYDLCKNAELILKERLNIEDSYLNDGNTLKHLKNIIVPSVSNDIQIHLINKLLKYNSPITLKLILIDDSAISYSIYNDIPQLLFPIITDVEKINDVFNWCSAEMEERIRKFGEYSVKNIDAFNEKANNMKEDVLPKIIIIVNETNKFFDKISIPIERMVMNCNLVGIYFILFSRFTLKRLQLGIMEELLEVYDSKNLQILISPTAKINEKQCIIYNFDNLEGHDFEYFCADVLRKNGFANVEVTQESGDHGIDILAEKDDITYAIQCKCYSSNIGNAAVQQAHTGKSIYRKDIAVVMTNRYFTEQATTEAKTLGVKLWNRDRLEEMIKTATH